MKAPILSIANLRLLVDRSGDFRRRVHPLLNPGVLMSYPHGAGGIVLSQVRPRCEDRATNKAALREQAALPCARRPRKVR